MAKQVVNMIICRRGIQSSVNAIVTPKVRTKATVPIISAPLKTIPTADTSRITVNQSDTRNFLIFSVKSPQSIQDDNITL